MTKYNIIVSQPKPRTQHYIDTNTQNRLTFDFGEGHDETRAKFHQLAQNLYHGDTLVVTAPERLVTEHFIVIDATKMHIKRISGKNLL